MLSQTVKGMSLCLSNDSKAPGADSDDMQSLDLLCIISLFFPAPAALGDSGALLLVIESSALRLPAPMGAAPGWYSRVANFQLTSSLAGVQEDAIP